MAGGRNVFAVSVFLAPNPGSTIRSRMKLRINRPEPISRTIERATWAATSMLRTRFRWRLPVELRPSSDNVPPRLGRDSCNDGVSPKRIPLRTEIATVNESTRKSMGISAT